MANARETELYGPVKQFFEGLGYVVRGEVTGCDLTAVRDRDVVLVEMKSRFNLTLVLQGIDRQQLGDTVYLAVDHAYGRRPARRWRSIQRLCRQLGLGLLTVNLRTAPAAVELVVEPQAVGVRRNRRKRRALLHEFEHRTGDHNVGGSTGQPIVTVYREQALRIAAYLATAQAATVAQVRADTGIQRSGGILQQNYYGWFTRIRHGTYTLSAAGHEAVQAYAHVLRAFTPPCQGEQLP